MPGNMIKINNSDDFEWYVGDSNMDKLIKFLDRIGFREKTPDQCPHCDSYNVEYSNYEWHCLDCDEQWDQYGQDTK